MWPEVMLRKLPAKDTKDVGVKIGNEHTNTRITSVAHDAVVKRLRHVIIHVDGEEE